MKIEYKNSKIKKEEATLVMVKVPAGFGCESMLVSETPITEAQWADVMGGEVKNPNFPKVNVTAFEAESFCRLLSESTGQEFRLPTELEQARCLGVEPENLEDYAVFNRGAITEVKTKLLNEYGLYDTRGLVWEWTQKDKENVCFMRGGSWVSYQLLVRAVYRDNAHAANRYNIIGFRVVLLRPPER